MASTLYSPLGGRELPMGTMPPGICGAMPWLLTGIMPFGGCPPGICSHCIEPVSGLSRLSAARSSE